MEKSKEYYEFRKTLKFLRAQRGQGTELISVYIQPGANVNEMANRLRDEYGQAMNIKSKQTRKNVQSAIDRILGMLKGVHKPPENGVAIFCGSIDGKIELYTVIPPEPVSVQTYRCDSTFLLEPLLELVEPKEVFGLVVMDRREATLALLKGKHTDILDHLTSAVPGKHKSGGQSALRFERITEIMTQDFYKRVAEHMNELYRDPKVRGIIVGGPGNTKNEMINSGSLLTDVQKKIAGTLDTSYTDEFGIKELTDRSGEIIAELEVLKEKDLVNKFLKEAVTGGLATYGEQQVREALAAGKVSTLLLSEGLKGWRVALKCPCGANEEKTVQDIEAFDKQQRSCPSCGGKPEVLWKKELVEELAEVAEQTDAKVEMISSDTAEGQQFLIGFGGIGAMLRYK